MGWRSGFKDWLCSWRLCSICCLILLTGCATGSDTPDSATRSTARPPPPTPFPATATPGPSLSPAPTAMPRPRLENIPTAHAAPTQAPTPSTFVGTPAPVLEGQLITSTARLDIYRIEGGITVTDLLDLAPRFEQAIDRVGERMEARLSGRVALSFEPPQRGPCALRGLTLSHQRIIRLYYAPET